MKKFLLYGIMAVGLLTTGCLKEVERIDSRKESFRLKVSVEEIGNNVPAFSRATVPAVEGEEEMDRLTLLFFHYSTSKTGQFVKSYEIDSPNSGDWIELEVGYGKGEGLSHTESYSILACANVSDYHPTLSSFEGLTEEEVERQMILTMDGAIPTDRLPMGGHTAKMANQETIDLRLTRAIVRLDVINTLTELYDLTSVTIYGARLQSHLWRNDEVENAANSGVFYGTGSSGSDAVVAEGRVTGGLYAFENFEGDPTGHPESTTSLVIGLTPKTTAPAAQVVGTPGTNYFYRVDIRPQESAQNLLRNNVYVVSVRGVLAPGKLTADQAAADPGGLDVSINNWNMDDEGMVITDGHSTMAVPSKFVRFGPDAETRSYDIFTSGPGTLSITRSDLPAGVHAELEGNTLTVTADALPANGVEQTGTFELGYGGLRGTITVIRSPGDDNFIELDKTTLEPWDSAATGDSPDANLITVFASGTWTARIYNTSSDEQNPGFAFNDVTGGAAPELVIEEGLPDGTIRIYSTGPNTTHDFRRGFMVVHLTGDGGKEYSRVIALTQNSIGVIHISPSYIELPFDAVGNATGVIGASGVQPYYRIDVSPGSDNPGGPLRAWKYELSPEGASEYFSVIRVDDGYTPYLLVSAIGDNPQYPGLNTTGAKEASLAISLDEGAVRDEEPVVLPITQEELTLGVRRIGRLSEVPVEGTNSRTKNWNDKRDDFTWSEDNYTEYVEYEVELNPALRYDLQIEVISNAQDEELPYRRHEAYLIGDDGLPMRGVKTLSGRSPERTIKIGYDKIYYPMVHWSNTPASDDYNIPEVEVTVSVPEAAGLEPVKFRVRQAPLIAQNLDILMASTSTTTYGGYGSFSRDGSIYAYALERILMNDDVVSGTANFGWNGVVKLRNDPRNRVTFAEIDTWTDGIGNPVGSDFNFFYGGSHSPAATRWELGAYVAAENWRRSDDTRGFLYFTGTDEAYYEYPQTFDRIRDPSSTLTQLGWQLNRTSSSDAVSSNDVHNFDSAHADKRVMLYALNGPFGAVATSGANGDMTLDVDGFHAAILRNSLGPHTVVLFTEDGITDNVLLAVDPVARFAFLGECLMFDVDSDDNLNEKRFVANFLSIFINSAQYGEHFMELLYEDCPQALYLPGQTTPVITAQ